jgi:hypothetical protein
MALATSTSAVHRAVARLQLGGLCPSGQRTVNPVALREFLSHGVRYAFPAIRGPERTGLPTGLAHPIFSAMEGVTSGPMLVWPTESGSVRGESLVPLFPGVVRVAGRDPRMYELLASVDVLRVGTPAQRAAALDVINRHLPA